MPYCMDQSVVSENLDVDKSRRIYIPETYLSFQTNNYSYDKTIEFW